MMSGSTPDAVQIDRLAVRFAAAVNRRRPDDVAELFTTDAVWSLPGLPEVAGGPGIVDQLGRILDGFELLVQMPQAGDIRVDGPTAVARCYVSEFSRDRAGRGSFALGVYHDLLVQNGAWRFARRRFDFLYRGPFDLGGKVYPFPVLPESEVP